ncbi:MAG: hypothetical protein JJ974_01135 [Phycisphaerales bacterium]|nr:hypothetical protein [Phycisphaerales bacterium]
MIPSLRLILVIFVLAVVSLISSCRSTHAPSHKHAIIPGQIKNLRTLVPTLYSGSEPSSLDHYRQLSDLGIKTVISVDAIAPDAQLAERFGIRVVHYPIGYDGISDQRAEQLAQAIAQLEHPIFLNCHHGTHRGPAALCVGAIGAGRITNTQAESFMTRAGTSLNYPGLWDAARTAESLDQSTLQQQGLFPERAPVSGFLDAMGQLDRLHDRMLDLAENGFETPQEHPDLSASAVSGQMYDLMRTIEMQPSLNEYAPEMRSAFSQSTEHARMLEIHIETHDHTKALESLRAFSRSCKDCHRRFRN